MLSGGTTSRSTSVAPTLRRRHPRLRWAFNGLVYYLAAGLIAGLRLGLRLLPYRLVVALGRPLGLLAAALAGPERRRALANLARVWPATSPARREALVRACFVNLGRSALECLSLERALDPRRCRLGARSRAAIEAARGEGRGVIFATAHFGNWELMAAAVARVAPVYVLARQSYDPRFTRLIERLRRQQDVRCIWVEGPMHLKRAVRMLRQRNAVVGILVDQPVRVERRPLFLGQPAPTTGAVSALHRLAGAPVVTGVIERVGASRHEIVVERCDPQRAGEALQAAIRRRPELWLWTLDRWRFGSTPEE